MDTIKKKSRNSYKILLLSVGSNPRLCAISKIRTLSGVAGFFFSVRGFGFQFMALWRSDTESKKPKMEKSVDTKMDTVIIHRQSRWLFMCGHSPLPYAYT